MESRIRNIFLKVAIGFSLLLPAYASGADLESEQELDPIIQPEIERSQFTESNIDTTDFEVIANVGIISIEDFGSSSTLILKLNYHISDDFFIGAEWSEATGEETSFEILVPGAPILSEDERDMTTYLITLGYNVLPGEAFVTDNTTYNTSFYLIGGLGKTEFGGDDHFTVSLGAGYRVLVSDFFALYTDFRNNMFNIDVFGEDKRTNNLQFSVGVGFYF